MKQKIYTGFKFVDTVEQAKRECREYLTTYSRYMKTRYGAPSFTPWTSCDRKENKFIVWYVYHV